MATLKLPTFPAQPDHRYDLTLDGQSITIEWHYNARAERWSVNLFDVTGAPIRHGVRLVIIDDLLKRVALETSLPGTLTVVDTTGADNEPDASNLGGEVQLRYVES